MGLVATKPVFGVSHQAMLKPASSATETSRKIEILLEETSRKIRYDTFQKANNKGADQSVQMRRLVCAFVVHKPRRQVFSYGGTYYVRLEFLDSLHTSSFFSKMCLYAKNLRQYLMESNQNCMGHNEDYFVCIGGHLFSQQQQKFYFSVTFRSIIRSSMFQELQYEAYMPNLTLCDKISLN